MILLDNDKKWGKFNERLERFMKENDLFGLATTYYEMADFLSKEGKDNNHLRKYGYQIKLKLQTEEIKRYKNSGILEKLEILATEDSCEFCKKLNGKIFLIKEAELENPIPVKNCTHKYGCRCVYLPVVK